MNTVTIKEKTYNLPPLTTGQIRRNAGPLLEAINGLAKSEDKLAALASLPELVGQHADLLFLALSNEHKDLTLDDVETLRFDEIQEAVKAVLEVSGLKGNAGEAKTQATASL